MIRIIIAISVLFIIVGSMDFSDAVQQDEFTCQMIKDGLWPNTNNLDCGE